MDGYRSAMETGDFEDSILQCRGFQMLWKPESNFCGTVGIKLIFDAGRLLSF